jgi:hypothetical protein
MSIKVYIHYEPINGPEKTSKLSVPKKWVTEKVVTDVLELFTDSYNKVNPEHALNKDEIHLITERYLALEFVSYVCLKLYDAYL